MKEDWGHVAHQQAQTHLNECFDALDEADFGDGEAGWPVTAGPFCGCVTCIVREVLHVAFPILRTGILRERA